MTYAASTEVGVERSRQQIEAMLKQRGCEGFASAWSKEGNRIEFIWGTIYLTPSSNLV